MAKGVWWWRAPRLKKGWASLVFYERQEFKTGGQVMGQGQIDGQ